VQLGCLIAVPPLQLVIERIQYRSVVSPFLEQRDKLLVRKAR
jgi:hypothetical protein